MARILAARNGRVQNSPPMIKRCWVGGDDPLMLAYHDEEWGVPVHDDRALFGKLVLDGFQAGLSWRGIPALGVEAVGHLEKAGPLVQDHAPRQPGREALEHELAEQGAVVVDGPAPPRGVIGEPEGL